MPIHPETAELVATAKSLEIDGDTATARDCWKWALARELHNVVKEWATPDEWARIEAGTLGPDEMCDANMAVAEAFERVFERAECFTDEGANESQAAQDLAIWNDAVTHANQVYYGSPAHGGCVGNLGAI